MSGFIQLVTTNTLENNAEFYIFYEPFALQKIGIRRLYSPEGNLSNQLLRYEVQLPIHVF